MIRVEVKNKSGEFKETVKKNKENDMYKREAKVSRRFAKTRNDHSTG